MRPWVSFRDCRAQQILKIGAIGMLGKLAEPLDRLQLRVYVRRRSFAISPFRNEQDWV